MVRKTHADAEQTRERILAEAKLLFEKQGYAESSIMQICEKSGVTKGALFHYFPNKESLFKEIWTDLQKQMDASSRDAAIAARSDSDPYAAFLAGIRSYFDWARRRDYQQIVLTDGPSVLGLAGWYEADSHLGRDNTLAGMRYLAHKGKIKPELSVPLAVLFHNALNGVGFAITRGGEGVTVENAMEAFEVMLKSMASDS